MVSGSAATAADTQQALSGEYSDNEMLMKFPTFNGTYTFTLKDAEGQEFYGKRLQTSSIVALTRDISKYPEGTYIITVENDEELYSASLTLPLSVAAVYNPEAPGTVNGKCYDLSGRLTATPGKGVYIRGGRKVIVAP